MGAKTIVVDISTYRYSRLDFCKQNLYLQLKETRVRDLHLASWKHASVFLNLNQSH